MFSHRRDRRQRLGGALSPGVKVDLAVLPVSHRTARLKSLMADVWRDKCFVQHERGILEACVEVAIRPFIRRLAHRQTAVLGFAKSASVHFSSVTAGAAAPGGVTQMLPSVRGFGPPGRSVSSGSTTNGSRSKSM